MNHAAVERFLKRPEVENIVGISCSGIYELMQDPDPQVRFPLPVKIGHRSRWRESAVRAWMTRQVERCELAA